MNILTKAFYITLEHHDGYCKKSADRTVSTSKSSQTWKKINRDTCSVIFKVKTNKWLNDLIDKANLTTIKTPHMNKFCLKAFP